MQTMQCEVYTELSQKSIWNIIAKTSLAEVSTEFNNNSINNGVDKIYKLGGYLFSLLIILFLCTSQAYADYEKVACTFTHKNKTYAFDYILYPDLNHQLQIISTFTNIKHIEFRDDDFIVKTIQSMQIGDDQNNYFKLERANLVTQDINVTEGKFMGVNATTLGITCDADILPVKIGENEIKEYKRIICTSRKNWWGKTNPEASKEICSLQ